MKSELRQKREDDLEFTLTIKGHDLGAIIALFRQDQPNYTPASTVPGKPITEIRPDPMTGEPVELMINPKTGEPVDSVSFLSGYDAAKKAQSPETPESLMEGMSEQEKKEILEPDPGITMEQLQSAAQAAVRRLGTRGPVKTMLEGFGVKKLTDIKPSDYKKALERLEGLNNA